jgi:excisionase family DNA binding protein
LEKQVEGSGNAETYLTVAEVAELLKLNQQTVRNWIDQGSLPALRVGRRVRIRRSDLDELLEAGSTRAGARGGPSGADFWGGTPVGFADPAPAGAEASGGAPANGSAGADPAPGGDGEVAFGPRDSAPDGRLS